MTMPRNLQRDIVAAARDRLVGVICRSGETWIVRTSDEGEHPALAQAGFPLPIATNLIALWDREPAQLDLPAFVAGVIGVDQVRSLSEMDLERGFEILVGGDGRRATTLLVQAAERLAPEVLHYIQFACVCSPRLQVVFIAGKAFRESLDMFPILRGRLQPDLVLPAFAARNGRAPRIQPHGPELAISIERAEKQNATYLDHQAAQADQDE
jgi:hypothetical protein